MLLIFASQYIVGVTASYMLLTASLVSVYNLSTVIFYLICYVILDILAFGFLNITEGMNIGMKIEDFKGLFRQNRGTVIAYVLGIIGLAGLPLTSGFIAKIYLFSAIVNSGLIFVPVLLILMLLTVLALYYYLKIVLPLFKECDKTVVVKLLKASYSQKFVLYITAAVTILIGVFPEKLIELCRFIAYNI